MSIEKICVGVLAILICSVGVSAQTQTQFPSTAVQWGDPGYYRQLGRDVPQPPAPQAEAWPYVALFVVCAVAAEKMRERRRENEWKREHPADARFAPLVQWPDEASKPSFQPVRATDLLNFKRPTAAELAADPSLHVVILEPAAWAAAQPMPTASDGMPPKPDRSTLRPPVTRPAHRDSPMRQA